MAIQHRQGKKVDFDPYKMLPGEWAVSIDTETEKQIVWMCFRAGVVKRMGTYEDFKEQIREATDDIREEYEQTFNEIKVYMEGLKTDTEGYKNTAAQKASEAGSFATQAGNSASSASASATDSANSADESENYSLQSKSYAKGTGGAIRPNDDSDCAEFFYEQTKRISQSFVGIVPMGTITFAQLSEPGNQVMGYMFDVSDEFVSDERFKNGSGIHYGAGNNVVYTADGMWDVLASTSVSGVKGDKETTYRQGYVNITPENIGAATVEDLENALQSGGTIGNLAPGKALISNSEGNVESSEVGADKLEMIKNAESDVQTQINASVKKSGDTMTGALKVPTLVLGSTPSDEVGAMWIE